MRPAHFDLVIGLKCSETKGTIWWMEGSVCRAYALQDCEVRIEHSAKADLVT